MNGFSFDLILNTLILRLIVINYLVLNESKKREITSQISKLRDAPPSYEISILIARLESEIEEVTYFNNFSFVRHYVDMKVDIYEILGTTLYWHFKRLLDTMNNNNVIEFEELAVNKRQMEKIRVSLKRFGLVKKLRLWKVAKWYVNPAFGIKLRKNLNSWLVEGFAEDNEVKFNIKL